MLQVSFIFTEKDLTAEFFALDALIEGAAETTEGFLGKDSWIAADGGRRKSVYYWRDENALAEFARHPDHLEAKRRYREWYAGFQVVVSELRRSYGDGALDHITPNDRRPNR